MKNFSTTINKLFSATCKCIHLVLLYYGLPHSPLDIPEIKYSFERTIRLVKKMLQV